MSANCDDEAVERLLSIGAADYFFKPVRTSTLTRLKGLTSRRKQVTSPRQKEATKPHHSLLSISLLQAAQLLSSDSPTNHCATALTQQPPSPPSSTPSPSLQETSYAVGGPSQGSTAACCRPLHDAGAAANAAGKRRDSGTNRLSSIPVFNTATFASTDGLSDSCSKVR